MVAHMKTTIEIPDALLNEAKAVAAREKTTLRQLVAAGLRAVLEARRKKRTLFKLPDASFRGDGLVPGVDLANWEQVRALVYEGRGG